MKYRQVKVDLNTFSIDNICNMKNIKASLILAAHLLFAFTMAGCDPATGYEYYLNNQSDSILIVMFKAEEFSRTNSDSTRVVEPKTETLFYDVKAWGKNPHGEKNNFLKMFDTIAVTT